VDENVHEIKAWEESTLRARTAAEHLSDWVSAKAASGASIVIHLVWFAAWGAVNMRWIPGIEPFDPFPFQLLTMWVSLEAIFLSLFVLASQNRLARQTDRRSHLDLQIDLLAEREMTAVLQLLRDIAGHLKVKTSVTEEQLRELARTTDVHKLTDRMAEFDREEPKQGPR
jgi:uncharacterized membrane protein